MAKAMPGMLSESMSNSHLGLGRGGNGRGTNNSEENRHESGKLTIVKQQIAPTEYDSPEAQTVRTIQQNPEFPRHFLRKVQSSNRREETSTFGTISYFDVKLMVSMNHRPAREVLVGLTGRTSLFFRQFYG